MKSLLITAFLFIHLTAGAQIYVQLKIVNGAATFASSVESNNLSAEEIHARSIAWIEKTFLSEPVVTLNTPARISARFVQEYSKDAWSDSFQHSLQIDIKGNTAVFTISDTGLSLIRDGEWKENLTKMRVMYEQAANELFWSYESALKQPAGNN